jgi:hypothetical protein
VCSVFFSCAHTLFIVIIIIIIARILNSLDPPNEAATAVAAPAESATPVPSHKTAESASLGLSKPNVEAGDRFDAVEQEFQAIMGDHAKLKQMWRKLDFNGNGKVSLAEVDKMMVEQFPVLNHKAALMRAFQKTTLRDGDGFYFCLVLCA